MNRVHPYVPNSAPQARREMLDIVGVTHVDELYEAVPAHLRLPGPLDLPTGIESEAELVRHVRGILRKGRSTEDFVSFLGAGAFRHHVPSVCDEVNSRAEFLTAYAGETYEEHGRHQALYEYISLMAELLEMDVVTVPTYDGYQAASTAVSMTGRLTGRREVLVVGAVDPDKLERMSTYAAAVIDLRTVGSRADGTTDLEAVLGAVSERTAAIYLETPDFLGRVSTEGSRLAAAAHAVGALFVVSTDPISLGALEPPSAYGADIVCGDIQSLGVHLQFGGGHGGFLAVHDDVDLVMELPSRLIGLAPTVVDGELGFIDLAYERTSLAARDDGVEWVGTAAALWGLTAGVFLALHGPEGMAELGATILGRTRYLAERLGSVPGIQVLAPAKPHFREIVVQLEKGSAAGVLGLLLERGILGGVQLSSKFPELGEALLVCATELTSRSEIDLLASALTEILEGELS